MIWIHNKERRVIEAQMQEKAFDILDNLSLDDEGIFGLCLYEPSWHEGVVGLVASRVKERYFRPVIVFAKKSQVI